MAIRRIDINAVKRHVNTGGSFDAGVFNDTLEEIIIDFNTIASQWNSQILPLLADVPTGSLDSAVDAFTNGLDGKTLFTDADADTSPTGIRYWNTSRDRPNTIKEQFEAIYSTIENLDLSVDQVAASTSSGSGGLTDAQKARIGINIFDASKTSSASSLDGLTAAHAIHLSALQSFTGQTSSTDSSPTYTSTVHVANGDSLEAAIGKLDAAILVGGADTQEIVAGGGIQVVTSSTASLSSTAYYVLVNRAGAVTINLPTGLSSNIVIKIKDISGSAGLLGREITIDGNGNNIDGQSTVLIQTNYGVIEVLYSTTQTEWYII